MSGIITLKIWGDTLRMCLLLVFGFLARWWTRIEIYQQSSRSRPLFHLFKHTELANGVHAFIILFIFRCNLTTVVTEEHQVRVITNYFPKFSPEELLATVGSCLGLWLGLGVIHIVDLFVTAAAQFFRRQFGWTRPLQSVSSCKYTWGKGSIKKGGKVWSFTVWS